MAPTLPLAAVDRAWQSGGINSLWSSSFNWSPGGVPANGDSLSFAGSGETTTNDLNGLVVSRLSFNHGDWQIRGNLLSVTNGIGVGPHTGIDAPFNITIDVPLVLGGLVLVTPDSLAKVFLQKQLSGSGGLSKSGFGTLILQSSNIFTGDLIIGDGIVEVLNDNWPADLVSHALGASSGNVTLINGSLTLSNAIVNNKNLFVQGTRPVTPNSVGSLLTSRGYSGWLNRIELDTNLVVYSDGQCAIGGPVVGPGGIEYLGSKHQFLGSSSSATQSAYTGVTLVLCEVLLVTSDEPFNGPLVVGGDFSSLHELRGDPPPFNITLQGPQLTLHTNALVNLNGRKGAFNQIIFNGGHFMTGSTGELFTSSIIVNPTNVTATMDGNFRLLNAIFDVADGPALPDLAIGGLLTDLSSSSTSDLIKRGSGELLLSGANTYSGLTRVEAGVLHVQNGSALGATSTGTIVSGGATLRVESVPALAEPLTISGAGRGGTEGALDLLPATGTQGGIVLAAPATVHVGSSFAILSSTISGTGPFTKTGAGSLQFGGGSGTNNTYSGDTLVNEGELVLDKPDGITAVPGHLIIGSGAAGVTTTVRQFHSFQIIGSVTVNRGGLWDLTGQTESWNIADLQGHPPLTLNGGGDVQTGTGIFYLPVGGDVVVDPAGVAKASSFISGNIGLDPGPHRFTVGSTLSVLSNIIELDVSAAISQTSTAADLVKEGSGDMRLSASNSFTGAMTVNGGNLFVAHGSALGTSAAGTTVNNGAALALEGGLWVKNESLTLNTTNPVALTSLGAVTNTWSGNVVLQQIAGIDVPGSGGALYFDSIIGCCAGIISGPGGLIKTGPGGMRFFGGPANTFTGPTTVNEGLVEAGRTQGPALSGNVTVSGPDSTLRTGHASGITGLPPAASMAVQDGALWGMNANNVETLSRLVGNGNVDLGSGSALTVSNVQACTFSGLLSGTGALNKRGPETFQVTANSYSYTGLATAVEGTYKVDGDILYAPATVKTGATLRGGGALGDVTVEPGGIVKVDRRYTALAGGALIMNSVNFQPSGGVLSLDFFGPGLTGGNDALYVNGAVTLGNLNLSAGFGYAPHEGDVITLIGKDAAGPVNGIINGFPEGSVQTIGNIPVQVSYLGGDGNDVTLTVTNLPLLGGGAQVVSGNLGGTLVPNDCSLLSLVVTNRGATTVSNLHGTLRSLTDGVVVTFAEAAFPDLAPNARGTNMTPFQVRTEPTFPCGAGAQFELILTASNAPTTAILYTLLGASGYALDFDGFDDQVEIPANTFSGVVNNFTIELWAKPTANRTQTAETNAGISGVNATLHQAQRFAVFPDRGNVAYGSSHVSAGLSIGRNGISAYEQGANYLPSRLVYSNAVSGWTHVALVYSNKAPRLYVNGALVRSGAASSFSSVHPSGSLGGSPQADYGSFQGQLDEVRIWNAVRSQSQIQSNMSLSLTGTETNLVTYFRCDEGGGSVLGDSASASPNPTGTVTNGAAFVFPGVVPFTPAGVSCDSGGGACESCLVVSGSFTTNTPTLAAPLDSSSPSVCFPAKACPGALSVPFLTPFIQHTFANTSGTQACVTAQLHFACAVAPNEAMQAAAYLGAFDTNDLCLNYLGDSGAYGTAAFSFAVPSGSNVVIVVSQRVPGFGCDSYTLELFGLPCPPPALGLAKDASPGTVRLSWSSAYPDYDLQSASTLNGTGPSPFLLVTNPPVLIEGKYSVSNTATAPRQFFRLIK